MVADASSFGCSFLSRRRVMAPAPRAAGLAAARGCQPGGWLVASLYRIRWADRGCGWGAASAGLAPRTAGPASRGGGTA